MTELGLVLSNAGAWSNTQDARSLLDLAELVDREPAWDTLWIGDSLLSVPRLESTVTLAALAARTERVRLGVGCEASLGLREPLLFALQWASLDVLSAGRVTLVACTGANRGEGIEQELRAFGLEHADRVARMEETVTIVREASHAESISHVGAHFRFEDVRLRPTFVQRPLPIWMTANPSARATPAAVRRVLERVARLGDGWMTFVLTPAQLAERIALLRELFADAGRDVPAAFPVCVYLDVNLDEDPDRAMSDAVEVCRREGRRNASPEALRGTAAIGGVDDCLAFIEPYLDAGATHLALRPVASDPRRQVERLTAALAPRLRAGAPAG